MYMHIHDTYMGRVDGTFEWFLTQELGASLVGEGAIASYGEDAVT